MKQDHIDRFLDELVTRGIQVTTVDRALLGCFLQWYTYDCMRVNQEVTNHED